MQVESGGDEHAISPRGALGLMQIMPGTWVELSVRSRIWVLTRLIRTTTSWQVPRTSARCTIASDRLASLPPTTRVQSGIEQHLATGRPLPPETQAYVAALTPCSTSSSWDAMLLAPDVSVPWRQAPLFVERVDSASIDRQSASAVPRNLAECVARQRAGCSTPHAAGLFVRRSRGANPDD